MYDLLPRELIDKIYKIKYRLEYDDVINQINDMFDNGRYGFVFKNYILNLKTTIIFFENYDDNDDDELNEVLFFDVNFFNIV